MHAICGREKVHAERFIRSFAPAVDEICLARALGSVEPDDTISICEQTCKEMGIEFKWVEYKNKTDFPHVDDFAAARNAALKLCGGEAIIWADFDDIIEEKTAQEIRQCASDMVAGRINYTRTEGQPPPHEEDGILAIHAFAKYDLATQGESAMRERIFTRACHPRWKGALHENLIQQTPSIRISVPFSWIHQPLENHDKDPKRNLRILSAATDMFDHYAFERARQEFIEWNQSHDKTDTQKQISWRWLSIALADPNCLAPRRYQGMVMQAALVRWSDPAQSRDILWEAIRLMPEQRDAYSLLADIELETNRPTRALCVWLAAIGQRKPAASGFQISERLYGWAAADLLCRCRRSSGDDPQESIDKQASNAGGYKIALLHATRGRARKAMETRQTWMESAHDPSTILHVFASDDDDEDTKTLEAMGALVLRNTGRSCVSAWNLAAEYASNKNIPILVQLSDDWIPCMHWDFFVYQSLKDEHGDSPLGEKPLVLRINDGNSNDDLMCMAILTLARYRDQGDCMFSPEYFGVYSDNEFSLRARKDGVVVDGTHINFRHYHPFYGCEKLDKTYQRQNDPDRYAEGKKIFERRNPKE